MERTGWGEGYDGITIQVNVRIEPFDRSPRAKWA